MAALLIMLAISAAYSLMCAVEYLPDRLHGRQR